MARRLPAFARRIPRIHTLCKAGIKVGLLVRASGTPAVTYGVEAVGLSDSHLQRARSAVARAAAPEGEGKDPEVVLWCLDGNAGTMDPAFDAHVLPIKFWALAVWQHWRPRYMLARALTAAP